MQWVALVVFHSVSITGSSGRTFSIQEVRAALAVALALSWNLVAWPFAWWTAAVASVPAQWVIPALALPVVGIGIAGAALGLMLELRRLPLVCECLEPVRGSFRSSLRFAATRRFEVGLLCERRLLGVRRHWHCVWREERCAGAWPEPGGTHIQFGLRVPAPERLPARARGESERWRLVLRVHNLGSDGDCGEREFRLPVVGPGKRHRSQWVAG